MFGLDRKKPYADGLEPADFFAREAPDGAKLGITHVEKQFSYNYLHNVSNSKLERNNQVERRQVDEIFEFYIPALRNEAYLGMFKLMKAMKETAFAQQFNRIIEHLWCLI